MDYIERLSPDPWRMVLRLEQDPSGARPSATDPGEA